MQFSAHIRDNPIQYVVTMASRSLSVLPVVPMVGIMVDGPPKWSASPAAPVAYLRNGTKPAANDTTIA